MIVYPNSFKMGQIVYEVDGLPGSFVPTSTPPLHAATHLEGGADPIAYQPHASRHAGGQLDPITTLGSVAINTLQVTEYTAAYAAAITIDAASITTLAITPLTGNLTITWGNVVMGKGGTIIVRQDGVGGRTVTLNPPAPYLLRRDSAVADLAADAGPNATTVYTYTFLALPGTADNLLIVGKIVPVVP